MFFNLTKCFIFIFLFVSIGLLSVIFINVFNILPTESEKKIFDQNFQKIEKKIDIIQIQNLLVSEISHSFLSDKKIVITEVWKNKKGFCYDRSLFLQKILTHNNIPIRPVFLYYYNDGRKITFMDFFNYDINSHNIFEFKWKNRWYVCRTNTKMEKFETLDEYLKSSEIIPRNAKYIRYIFSRNMRFISPSFIPDIYMIP